MRNRFSLTEVLLLGACAVAGLAISVVGTFTIAGYLWGLLT
jgi:hypothetical protein